MTQTYFSITTSPKGSLVHFRQRPGVRHPNSCPYSYRFLINLPLGRLRNWPQTGAI